MDIKLDIRNPYLIALAFLVLIGGSGWYAWKYPERFMQIVRSNYDREAIVNTEELRAALEPDLLIFLRHELIKEMVANQSSSAGTINMGTPLTITEIHASPVDYFRNAQDFALSRTDRRVRLKLNYQTPTESGEATGEASLSRARRWSLTSVTLVR